MSGETTTVRPGRSSAGSWKQSDLPPPVGKQREDVAPSERGFDDLPLQRPEGVVAECSAERFKEQVGHENRHGLARHRCPEEWRKKAFVTEGLVLMRKRPRCSGRPGPFPREGNCP